jgi:hypothetical protein
MAECACGAECDTAGSWCLVAPDASSHVAASSSRNAVSFSSDRTVKRRPSRVYASAVKITRPVKSISDEQPQLKPALLQSAESQFCSNAHRPLASLRSVRNRLRRLLSEPFTRVRHRSPSLRRFRSSQEKAPYTLLRLSCALFVSSKGQGRVRVAESPLALACSAVRARFAIASPSLLPYF